MVKKKTKSGLLKPIRVIIADDHPLIREGLRALIKAGRDMKLVGEAATGRQAVEQFFQHRPDVMLLDLRMPEMDGVEAMKAILKKAPKAKIIVLSAYAGSADIFRALRAGAKAYLLKDSPSEQLLESIREVYRGHVSIPQAVGEKLAYHISAPKLTKREKAIIELIVLGKSNKEIGALLGITEGTAKVHVGHILKKLGVTGRTEAIRVALQRGIVHLEPYYEL
jgi:DNA-binding NarL/FixJ family response regulator